MGSKRSKVSFKQSFRQAIATKWIGPTNHRGSRVKAYAECGLSVTIPWDDALDVAQNHHAAARAFVEAQDQRSAAMGWGLSGWHGAYVSGSTAEGYVFVRVS